jgi:quinol monooxygenase YgiN
VDKVKAAIEEFVSYVAANEPGSPMYTAWQQADDPTRFVHLFEFADEAAHQAHGSSGAVRHFEAIYGPELVAARSSSPTTTRSPPTTDPFPTTHAHRLMIREPKAFGIPGAPRVRGRGSRIG